MKPSAKKVRPSVYSQPVAERRVRLVCAWCGIRMSAASPVHMIEVVSHGICFGCRERILADFEDPS